VLGTVGSACGRAKFAPRCAHQRKLSSVRGVGGRALSRLFHREFQTRSRSSEPIFPALRLASQTDLFVAGIRRRGLHRFSARCGVLMLHANRSGNLGPHETHRRHGCSMALRGAHEGCVRIICAPPGCAAQARARRQPHHRLEHSRHRDGRVLLTITLAPQATAAAAPQCCLRRRLPPTLARFLRRRLARLLPAHGCSRRWPTPRARPPGSSPRVPAPRSSAAAAAQGCSRRRLVLRLASCAAGTWT